MYVNYFKRPLDFILSLMALVILSPVLFVVAVMVRIKLGKPVIFKQKRPGLREKIFVLYKFRTMTDERGNDGKLLSDRERLTKFGKWLRSTSLDELPELWNVLKGDMSLVGPRPLLVEYLPRYSRKQKRRHNVRPGLTGLAQVSGRNMVGWEDRFRLDIEYVRNINLLGDFIVILKTFSKIVKKEGINSNDCTTMEVYIGNESKGER